jgi:hypothetical protein
MIRAELEWGFVDARYDDAQPWDWKLKTVQEWLVSIY